MHQHFHESHKSGMYWYSFSPNNSNLQDLGVLPRKLYPYLRRLSLCFILSFGVHKYYIISKIVSSLFWWNLCLLSFLLKNHRGGLISRTVSGNLDCIYKCDLSTTVSKISIFTASVDFFCRPLPISRIRTPCYTTSGVEQLDSANIHTQVFCNFT